MTQEYRRLLMVFNAPSPPFAATYRRRLEARRATRTRDPEQQYLEVLVGQVADLQQSVR